MTDYRCAFSLLGDRKFLSHLDLLTMWQRAMRRAQIPVGYSQGFNPHTLFSFGPAHSVGVEDEAVYFDITLTKAMRPADLQEKVNAVLPEQIMLHTVKELPARYEALMACINLATYEVQLKEMPDECQAQTRIKKLLQLDHYVMERITPKGVKSFDLRPAIHQLHYAGQGLFIMDILLGNSTQPRPQEVMAACGYAEKDLWNIKRSGLYVVNEKGERRLP